MPTITIKRKVFEELVGKALSDDALKDRIGMLGTDLETLNKDEIETEIFPNRPDLLSVQGFARAFSSFIGVKKGLRKYDVKPSGDKVIIDKSLKNIRPYTACAIVKGIKYTDERIKEVIQVQEKLHVTYGRNRRKVAIGIYPFEKIKTPITFTAKKSEDIVFRPLEFPRKINAKQILSQHPAGRDYGHLLEGMDKFPVFLDADGNVLSVPPIINSHVTGKINENTTDIFIECSGFDFHVLQKCLNMLVCAMAEMGGDVYSMELWYQGRKYVTPNLKPDKKKINLPYVNKKLGLELKEKDLKGLLERMGYGYEKGSVLIPAYRTDIIHEIDFVEDIAIAYGYENFESTIPNAATIGEEDKFEVFKQKIADILVGLGLLQTNTFNLANKLHQSKLMGTEFFVIPLANALSEEHNVMRAWVIPSVLEIFAGNKHHDYPQKIFTIGEIFKKGKSSYGTGVAQATRLGVGLCNDRTDYTEIKQTLDYLFRTLDVKYSIEETEHSSFIPGRVGRVYVNKKAVCYIGEIHPKVLTNWELTFPVTVFELNLTDLFDVIK